MADSFELDPVDWITAGAVGEPGERTFFIQARVGHEVVALVVEKGQVRSLAKIAQDLLGRVGVQVTPDDLDTSRQQLMEPLDAVWRAGSLSIGMDPEGERFILEAEEYTDAADDDEDESAAVARFWMNRDQLVSMAAYAAWAVEAGARETCRLCSRPVDPVTGHTCPAQNGYGPLTM